MMTLKQCEKREKWEFLNIWKKPKFWIIFFNLNFWNDLKSLNVFWETQEWFFKSLKKSSPEEEEKPYMRKAKMSLTISNWSILKLAPVKRDKDRKPKADKKFKILAIICTVSRWLMSGFLLMDASSTRWSEMFYITRSTCIRVEIDLAVVAVSMFTSSLLAAFSWLPRRWSLIS